MDNNLSSILPFLLDGLPPEFIGNPERNLLEKITRGLPLASGGILELPLSENTGPAGLGVYLTEFSLLETPETSFQINPAAKKTWDALKTFAQTRKATGSALRRGVSEGWLEFDLTPHTESLPVPGFFFKLDQPFNHPATTNLLKETAYRSSVDLIQQGLQALGAMPSEESLATLIRCIQARDATSSIAYIGLMMGRKAPGFRLVLSGMSFYGFTGYLKTIGYPQRRGLVPLVDFLTDKIGINKLSLHLDIHGDVQPRLGLEVSLDQQQNLPVGWQDFLGKLIHTGAATPQRANALPAWIRQFDRGQFPQNWPEALGRKYSKLRCSINHIKFSYQPGYFSNNIQPGAFDGSLANQARAGEISSKAYLAYQYAAGLAPTQLWALGAK